MAIVFDEQESLQSETQAMPTEEEEEEDNIKEDIEETTITTLKDRLKEAVKEENYELATKLRDEIKRREENQGN